MSNTSSHLRVGSLAGGWRGGGVTKTCEVCAALFVVPRSKASRLKSCSLACGRVRRVKPKPFCAACGSRRVKRFVRTYCSPACSSASRPPRPVRTDLRYITAGKHSHVKIVEQVLGKTLPQGAHIHHVNGNGRDNSHSNLVVCQNQSYHLLLHSRLRVLRRGGNPHTQRICGRCNSIFDIGKMIGWDGNGYKCRSCYVSYYREATRERPT